MLADPAQSGGPAAGLILVTKGPTHHRRLTRPRAFPQTPRMAKRKDQTKPSEEHVADLRSLLTADVESEVAESVAPGSGWARGVLEGQHVPPSAPLDPALAAALVAELFERGDAEALGALAGQRADRALAKTARTAAHKLRTRGVEVTVKSDSPSISAPQPDPDDVEEGIISGYDGRGHRIIWLLQPATRGVLVHRGRLSWRGGLLELKTGKTTRREYRRIVRELQSDELALAEIEGPLARWYLHDGAQRVKALGRGLPEGYLMASRLLGKVSDDPHPGRAIEPRAEDLLGLYDSMELIGWQPDRESMQELVGKLQAIAESRVLVDEAQRRSQAMAAIESAASSHFAEPERRAASQHFLLDVAHVAVLRQQDELAGRLRAAVDLFDNPEVGAHPFGQRFVERVFDLERVVRLPEAPTQAEAEAETEPSGLVLP